MSCHNITIENIYLEQEAERKAAINNAVVHIINNK